MSDFPCCDPEPCGVPDVDYGPVWVEPIEEPAKPPFGSDVRAEYDRKEAAFPQLDALRYAATNGQASELADRINQLAADWGKALRETDSWRAAAWRIDERVKRLEAELVDVKTFLASAHRKIVEQETAIDRAYKDGYDTGKMHTGGSA